MLRFVMPLLLAAACAASQEPSSASPPAEGWTAPGATPAAKPAPAADGDEQVCQEERVTGSNLSRTVCRSRSDDDREREEAQQFGRKNSRVIQKSGK